MCLRRLIYYNWVIIILVNGIPVPPPGNNGARTLWTIIYFVNERTEGTNHLNWFLFRTWNDRNDSQNGTKTPITITDWLNEHLTSRYIYIGVDYLEHSRNYLNEIIIAYSRTWDFPLSTDNNNKKTNLIDLNHQSNKIKY
jgi:hypothetical protein